MVRKIIIVIFVLFAGFCAMGAIFCRRTLHVARRTSAAPQNVETVSITAEDGAKLSGWWMMPPKRNGNCVVVLHGIGGSRTSSLRFAPMFLKAGYNLLLPVRAIASAATPILLIHGLSDSRTPYSDSERLERANPRNALWLVPNAQHTGALEAAP
jgi:dipeptidyl aminopeptidase/acylaminoacyl peptidase